MANTRVNEPPQNRLTIGKPAPRVAPAPKPKFQPIVQRTTPGIQNKPAHRGPPPQSLATSNQTRLTVEKPAMKRAVSPPPMQVSPPPLPVSTPEAPPGLSGNNAYIGANMAGLKTPFTCVVVGCDRIVTPGPDGERYFKADDDGPYCTVHYADEFVTHTRANAGPKTPPCSFGVKYDDDQLELMKKINEDLQAQFSAKGLKLTHDLLNEAFKKFPKLKNTKPCRNCQEIITWWPDSRSFETGITE